MIFNMLLLQLNASHRTCLCTDAVFGPHEYDAMMHQVHASLQHIVPGSPYAPDSQDSHEAPGTPIHMITLLMK